MQIDWFRLVVGILAILFGAYAIFVRAKSKDSTKLNAIKKQWGEDKGAMIHLIFYGFLPVILGGLMLFKAIKGWFQ
ncbi:MAG: hypothetical protein ACI8V8_002152 [Chitinophagales bacterium]|jgi:hypothetical protein